METNLHLLEYLCALPANNLAEAVRDVLKYRTDGTALPKSSLYKIKTYCSEETDIKNIADGVLLVAAMKYYDMVSVMQSETPTLLLNTDEDYSRGNLEYKTPVFYIDFSRQTIESGEVIGYVYNPTKKTKNKFEEIDVEFPDCREKKKFSGSELGDVLFLNKNIAKRVLDASSGKSRFRDGLFASLHESEWSQN